MCLQFLLLCSLKRIFSHSLVQGFVSLDTTLPSVQQQLGAIATTFPCVELLQRLARPTLGLFIPIAALGSTFHLCFTAAQTGLQEVNWLPKACDKRLVELRFRPWSAWFQRPCLKPFYLNTVFLLLFLGFFCLFWCTTLSHPCTFGVLSNFYLL